MGLEFPKKEEKMKIIRILAVIMFGLSLSSVLSSQEMLTGSIRGKVAEASGQPLPGVSIAISGPRLLGTINTMTRADGTFRASYISPGSEYEIKAELSGFQTVVRKGIIINAGKTIYVEIEMAPSAIAEEVTVVAPSPTVDVVKSETSMTIVAGTLNNLPLPRDIISGFKIAPSVVSYQRGGLSRGSMTGHGEGEAGLTVDGIQMNDSDNGFAYMDVFNLLGAYTITDIRNPAGTWLPTDANTTAGTYTAGTTRVTGIIGSRLVKFSVFFRF